MHGRYWTKEEDEILRSNYGKIKVVAIAALLVDRNEDAIWKRAHRLELQNKRVAPQYDRFPNWVAIQKQLETGPKSTRQIADATGLRVAHVRDMLKRRRGRTVYILGWTSEKGDGGDIALYALGENRHDTPQPKKLTQAQRDKQYKKRLRESDPETYYTRTARDRLKRAIKTGKLVKPDPAASWMFNPTC